MKTAFDVAYREHILKGDSIKASSKAPVLILHGAGQSHRGKMDSIRQNLLKSGIGSSCFDFVGHGETGGDLKTSSLSERLEQSRTVIETLKLQEPLCLLAASMGAHTAVHLLGHYAIEKLVLLVPAAYSRHAEHKRFDQGFTETIRRPESWRESDVWSLLSKFEGQLLIVAGEDDSVIPKGVIDLLFDSATSASKKEIYHVKGVGHYLFNDLLENNPTELIRLQEAIAQLFAS